MMRKNGSDVGLEILLLLVFLVWAVVMFIDYLTN